MGNTPASTTTQSVVFHAQHTLASLFHHRLAVGAVPLDNPSRSRRFFAYRAPTVRNGGPVGQVDAAAVRHIDTVAGFPWHRGTRRQDRDSVAAVASPVPRAHRERG